MILVADVGCQKTMQAARRDAADKHRKPVDDRDEIRDERP